MKEYVPPLEPHFDDERTVLTARPVVPLVQINARVRHRRQWFLGGAFAIAMMLGAASALLASYFKLRNVPSPAAQVAEEVTGEVDTAPAPVAVAEGAPAATPEPEAKDVANVEEESAPESVAKKEVKHRTVVVRANRQPAESRDTGLSENEDLRRIRQAVLIDEWEERRARRVERRERRRAEQYNHRDLSNLDEIFEGRRRP